MQVLYIAIKDELLARIEDGTYPVGSIIPSEMELAESYGVSRPTIRQALQLLADAGYLDRRRRRGTVVCDPSNKDDNRIVHGANENVEGIEVRDTRERNPIHGERHVRTLVIRTAREAANAEVAEALGVPEGSEVYKLVRVRYMDESPNIFMVNNVLAEQYPDLLSPEIHGGCSLYTRMAEVGRPVVNAHRHLELVEADSTVAEILDVPVGDALFLFKVVGYDDEGRAVEYSRTVYRGKENSFEFSTEHAPSAS